MLLLLLIGSRAPGPAPVVIKAFGRAQTQSQQKGAATVASVKRGEVDTGRQPT